MRSIVILGAGFAGIAAAKAVGRALGRDRNVCITVVDRHPLHLFTPLLYELATAFVEHRDIGTARLIRSGITSDVSSMLARWGVNFVQAEVVGADAASRHVHLSTGISLRYDSLIVALGSETNYFGIPGMEERAMPLKTAPDAERIRRRVHDLLHRQEQGDLERFTIAVGGAGPAGTELAAELIMLLRRHLIKGHLQPRDFSVELIQSRERVLPMADPRVSAVALERLRQLGVSVHLHAAVERVDPPVGQVGGGTLMVARAESAEPGAATTMLPVSADVIVWTGGVKGNPVLAALGLAVEDRGGRVPVHASLEAEGQHDVFVLGDSALLMDPATGRPVPWLAQAAVEHGRVAGTTVGNRVLGRPDAQYRFRAYPMIVTVGAKFAILQVGRFVVSGLAGWVLRGAADLRYFLGILPPIAAVRVWWNGIRVYTRND